MERDGTEFHRHHHAKSCAQDVERRRAQRTGAVDERVVVILRHRRQRATQMFRGCRSPGAAGRDGARSARNQIDVVRHVLDCDIEEPGAARHHLTDAPRRGRRTEPERRGGARTHVDKQHAQTLAAEAGGEIDGRGGLAAAALLVGDRYYLHPPSSTLRARFIRVRPHGCGLWLLRRFWNGESLRVPRVPYTKEKKREERRTRV